MYVGSQRMQELLHVLLCTVTTYHNNHCLLMCALSGSSGVYEGASSGPSGVHECTSSGQSGVCECAMAGASSVSCKLGNNLADGVAICVVMS